MFHPRSIAIVGVSTKERDWGGGNMFLIFQKNYGFDGPIYPIHPTLDEMMGLKCYPSLVDAPGPVDHVISSIPASGVLQLMTDAAAKGVRCVHFFTAGFRETGEQERIELEQHVLAMAREAGIRLIGPNCMGLYCPSSGLSFNEDFPHEPGPVAFISQSGLNAEDLVHRAMLLGLRFSKVISYGNAADLDESDFFEYCTVDPDTEIIISYIEGVKDGDRFRKALRQASAVKPVVILKGGLTDAGSRAANSHTGSLAGSAAVWNALCRQTGVVSVESLDELVDVAIAFRHLRRPAGRGVAVIVVGGGASVLAADTAERVGLKLPAISDEVQAELRKFTPIAGTSIRNPLDTVALEDREGLQKTVNIIAQSPGIDTILILPRLDWPLHRTNDIEAMVRSMVSHLGKSVHDASVPVALAMRDPENARQMQALELFYRFAAEAGIPCFPDFTSALNAISKFVSWHEARDDSRD